MPRLGEAFRCLLGSLAAILVAALALFNAYRWFLGRGLEPAADNLIMGVALLVVLTPAAFVSGLRYWFAKPGVPVIVDVLHYGGAAALASGALLTLVDYADDYFTPGGVGLGWPLAGFIAGLCFGLVFRLLLSLAAFCRRSS